MTFLARNAEIASISFMRIEALAVKNFPPFDDASVNFPRKALASQLAEVHILTGQNGVGKTRLLSLLAAALGNSAELKSRVANNAIGIVYCAADHTDLIWKTSVPYVRAYNRGGRPAIQVGMAGENGHPKSHGDNIRDLLDQITPKHPFAAMAFKGVASGDDSEVSALKPLALKSVEPLLKFAPSTEERMLVDQGIVNIKMLAAMDLSAGEEDVDTRSTRISRRLEGAISDITGKRFRFFITNTPKVSLKVNWGGSSSMFFRELPDGLRSIIGWLAACVAKLDIQFPKNDNPLEVPLVLLLDEPEGHLHPAWQRKIIPAAQALFPNAQIFVSTHSPFVISSVNEGWIHVLKANDSGKVVFEAARTCSKGDSYIDIVEDILGVKEWYDPETENLLKGFRDLKNIILGGNWACEPELYEKGNDISNRSESLRDLIGGEFKQFERLKQKALERA